MSNVISFAQARAFQKARDDYLAATDEAEYELVLALQKAEAVDSEIAAVGRWTSGSSSEKSRGLMVAAHQRYHLAIEQAQSALDAAIAAAEGLQFQG